MSMPSISAVPSASGPTWQAKLMTVLPLGLIAWMMLLLADHPAISHLGISALTLAMCAGMVACNTLPRHWIAPLAPGMQVARQTLLRLGVAFYGLRLTFGSIEALGIGGVMVPLIMLAATMLVGIWAGTALFGLTRREAILVSAGSAVCGAAAAIAVSSVIRTDDKQTAVAVATVVLFGTAGMLLYPYLFELVVGHWHWAISERAFGIYTGSTLHEVAQVIAAGKMVSDTTADAAVIAKMVRVLALGPLLLVMAFYQARAGQDTKSGSNADIVARRWPALKKSIPWFALGFIAVMAINSGGYVPAAWKPPLVAVDNWMLACAMLAIGLHTRISDLLSAGRKALALAAMLFVFLAGAGALLCSAVL